MITEKERKLLNVNEAAAYMKVSSRTIFRRIAEGQLPAFYVAGDNVRLWLHDLQAAALARPVVPGAGKRHGRPPKGSSGPKPNDGHKVLARRRS